MAQSNGNGEYLTIGQLVSHKRMSVFGRVIGVGITSKHTVVYMCEVPKAYPLHIWCGTIQDVSIVVEPGDPSGLSRYPET